MHISDNCEMKKFPAISAGLPAEISSTNEYGINGWKFKENKQPRRNTDAIKINTSRLSRKSRDISVRWR